MKNTLLALTLTASSAFAQQPAPPAAAGQVDARFEAWIGCWRLDDDLAGTGARMCITPDKGGVRMQTVVGTQRGIDEVVIGDAVAHPIADAECKGTELAEWSADGARLFRTTSVTCGKEAPRTIKSVAFMAPGPSWINVQHVSGAAADTAVRVQRYRRAFNQQLPDGSKAPQPEAGLTLRTSPETTRWSIEDVIEASGKVPAEVVQAALTEVRQGFDLNKRTLVMLDDGGVDKGVIDLMVALTYPKRFVVDRRGGGSTPTGILTGGGWYDPMISPMMGGFADCYSPYGYGYRSYYSMCNMLGYSAFGYGYYGYNNYYNNGWVNVARPSWHRRRQRDRTAGRRPCRQRARLHAGPQPRVRAVVTAQQRWRQRLGGGLVRQQWRGGIVGRVFPGLVGLGVERRREQRRRLRSAHRGAQGPRSIE